MTTKNAKKRFARDVQALTGRNYQSACNLLNQWTDQGVAWKDGIAKLSTEANAKEDASACPIDLVALVKSIGEHYETHGFADRDIEATYEDDPRPDWVELGLSVLRDDDYLDAEALHEDLKDEALGDRFGIECFSADEVARRRKQGLADSVWDVMQKKFAEKPEAMRGRCEAGKIACFWSVDDDEVELIFVWTPPPSLMPKKGKKKS